MLSAKAIVSGVMLHNDARRCVKEQRGMLLTAKLLERGLAWIHQVGDVAVRLGASLILGLRMKLCQAWTRKRQSRYAVVIIYAGGFIPRINMALAMPYSRVVAASDD